MRLNALNRMYMPSWVIESTVTHLMFCLEHVPSRAHATMSALLSVPHHSPISHSASLLLCLIITVGAFVSRFILPS